MTDIESVTSPASTAPSPEYVSPQPSRAQVLDAIMRETGCSRSAAGNVLKWIKELVVCAREANYDLVYPTERELEGMVYRLFDMIMPHGKVSTPGSAHALIEAFVLDPTQGEIGLIHDMTDTEGSPSYCTVQVSLGVIR